MKRVSKTKSGEKAEVEYLLDEEKIAEEERYDGYHAVATNLLDPAEDILAVSHKRYQIEECFRIMKTNFGGRPVNHRLPPRSRAQEKFLAIRPFPLLKYVEKMEAVLPAASLSYVDDSGNIRGNISGFLFVNTYGNAWSEPGFLKLINRIVEQYNKEAAKSHTEQIETKISELPTIHFHAKIKQRNQTHKHHGIEVAYGKDGGNRITEF